MPASKLCSIERNMSVQEITPTEDAHENMRERVKPPACGNDAVKREMAEALLAQGLNEDAVCRLLHIDPEQIPDNG